MSEFSTRLKAARKEQKLTQQALADAAQLLVRQYVRYENGEQEPTLSKAAAIAKSLNMSLDYLSGLADEEKPL